MGRLGSWVLSSGLGIRGDMGGPAFLFIMFLRIVFNMERVVVIVRIDTNSKRTVTTTVLLMAIRTNKHTQLY